MLPEIINYADEESHEFRKSIVSGKPKTMFVIRDDDRPKYLGLFAMLSGNKCEIINNSAAMYHISHDVIFDDGISINDITFNIFDKGNLAETHVRMVKMPDDILNETIRDIALGKITEAPLVVSLLTMYEKCNGTEYMTKVYTDVRCDDKTVDLYHDNHYNVTSNSERIKSTDPYDQMETAVIFKNYLSYGLTVWYIFQKVIGDDELKQFVTKCKCKHKYCGKEITVTKYSIACQKLILHLAERMKK